MDLPSDLKTIFLGWLEEEFLNAHTKNQDNLTAIYGKALKNLRNSDLPIKKPIDLIQIQYVGNKIVAKMEKRLQKYCKLNGFIYPQPESPLKKRSCPDDDQPTNSKKIKKKITKKYVPAKRSGAYAILKALYLYDRNLNGMTKDEIIRKAGPFCDKSFIPNPSIKNFYSAWTSSKTLLNNDLIKGVGRPIHYYLTEEGLQLAENLHKVDEMDNSDDLDNLNDLTPLDQHYNNIHENQPNSHKSKFDSYLFSDLNNQTGTSTSDGIKLRPIDPYPSYNHKIPSNDIINQQNAIPSSIRKKLDNTEYVVWQPSDYQVLFYLDNREIRAKNQRNYFYDKLSEMGINVHIKSLTLGDGLWIAKNIHNHEEVVLDFIFERKRLGDYVSSIKDGRFYEQKSRLEKAGLEHSYYLIEEFNSTHFSSIYSHMETAIRTGVSQTITQNKFLLKRLKDSDETLIFLKRLNSAVIRYYNNKKIVVIKSKNIETQNNYKNNLDHFKHHFKKDKDIKVSYNFVTFQDILSKSSMMTVKEMFIRMLMTIKGLSLEKAIVIQSYFETPKNLLEYYKTNSKYLDEKSLKRLLNQKFKNEIQRKNIGPKLSESIYEVWGKLNY
ncbi:Mus81p [Ascoidea rubescens DSM 1968]|uniref:Crossover junction endonuclease MUS81 n=1 Tax=Ascoidea rubescens DSM 1968 TaxID=1344418 RepID=A0A1D2VQJ5_9ASCO|nr:ERCC4-domain-containing protein [Ascoidea rubescens DSM 1968]ODV63883.1 ERCC4-domain-containing protein [Ascoidea rubescens DSM 1968]